VRRWCILLVACVCLAAGVLAQPAKPLRIAYLTGYSAAVDAPLFGAFKRGMAEHGYVEGRNVVIEARWGEGDPQRLPRLAEELGAWRPDILVIGGGAATPPLIAKFSRATPIVMANVQDPVSSGLVKSLARPGGMITGMSDFHAASVTKRLELMKEAIPGLTTVAVFWNPNSRTNAVQLEDLKRSAPSLALRVVSVPVRNPAELDAELRKLKADPGFAIQMLGDFVLTSNIHRIAKTALDLRIPAVYTTRAWADAGGFFAYGTSFEDLYRRSAQFVDRIAKGANPGDLPIEQPTKFDLVLNQRTARAIGVHVPRAFVLRADYVIE
jgi:putative tryptophan/tyrosine transport system substrate-binding protein